MRHVSRTHRVHLDWLYERFLHDPHFRIRYVQAKYQIADLLTKGAFTKEKWKELLQLCSTTQTAQQKKKEESTHAHGLCSRSSQPRLVCSASLKGKFKSRMASTSSAMQSAMLVRSLDSGALRDERTMQPTQGTSAKFDPRKFTTQMHHKWQNFEPARLMRQSSQLLNPPEIREASKYKWLQAASPCQKACEYLLDSGDYCCILPALQEDTISDCHDKIIQHLHNMKARILASGDLLECVLNLPDMLLHMDYLDYPHRSINILTMQRMALQVHWDTSSSGLETLHPNAKKKDLPELKRKPDPRTISWEVHRETGTSSSKTT